MLTHANISEMLLWLLAVLVLISVFYNQRRVARDVRNISLALDQQDPDLVSPRASLAAARGAKVRKNHDVAMALVFVALTTWAIEVPPPPPGTFWDWQVRFGQVILFVGLMIIGSASLSVIRSRAHIEDAIHEDDRERRRLAATAEKMGG